MPRKLVRHVKWKTRCVSEHGLKLMQMTCSSGIFRGGRYGKIMCSINIGWFSVMAEQLRLVLDVNLHSRGHSRRMIFSHLRLLVGITGNNYEMLTSRSWNISPTTMIMQATPRELPKHLNQRFLEEESCPIDTYSYAQILTESGKPAYPFGGFLKQGYT